MATQPDPAAIAAACKDDLGRARQEELPLSTRMRNGSSFFSNYDSYADCFDKPFKDSLENSWNVLIEDEESEQMEGLVIPHARPWATEVDPKSMSFGPQASTFTSAPQMRQKKAPQTISSSVKPKLNSHQINKTTTKTSLVVDQKENAVDNNGTVKESEESAMHLLHSGECTMQPDQGFGGQANFKIHLNRVTRLAFLSFITQRMKRGFDYNVLDLSSPELKGEACYISKIRGDNQGQFRVQLSTKEKTYHFKVVLEVIQKSAATVQAFLNPSSSSFAPIMPPVAKNPKPAVVNASPSAKLTEPKSTKGDVINDDSNGIPKPSLNGSEEVAAFQVNSQDVLVDLNVTPTKGNTKRYSVEELAEDLHDFVAAVRHRLQTSSVSPFAEKYEEVENAAFVVWSQKDAIHSSEPPLKQCLPPFFGLLSKIGTMANYAPAKKDELLKIGSLIDVDNCSSTSSVTRLQYSASQIMRMRSHAAPFVTEHISPAPAAKKQGIELHGLAALQQFKGWLGNQNQENVEPQKIGFNATEDTGPTIDFKSQVSVNKIVDITAKPVINDKSTAVVEPVTDTKPAAPVKPTIAAAAKPKGLASSRWAS